MEGGREVSEVDDTGVLSIELTNSVAFGAGRARYFELGSFVRL